MQPRITFAFIGGIKVVSKTLRGRISFLHSRYKCSKCFRLFEIEQKLFIENLFYIILKPCSIVTTVSECTGKSSGYFQFTNVMTKARAGESRGVSGSGYNLPSHVSPPIQYQIFRISKSPNYPGVPFNSNLYLVHSTLKFHSMEDE